MYEIIIKNKAYREYKKIKKSNIQIGDTIYDFLVGVLAVVEKPSALANAKKLRGYNGKGYRWRIGDYRIIGIIEDGEVKIIEIIKIAHRKEAYE